MIKKIAFWLIIRLLHDDHKNVADLAGDQLCEHFVEQINISASNLWRRNWSRGNLRRKLMSDVGSCLSNWHTLLLHKALYLRRTNSTSCCPTLPSHPTNPPADLAWLHWPALSSACLCLPRKIFHTSLKITVSAICYLLSAICFTFFSISSLPFHGNLSHHGPLLRTHQWSAQSGWSSSWS